jgi:lipopolysaccharide/colanic/teichoic acid biosynthesis glycosyltransferase
MQLLASNHDEILVDEDVHKENPFKNCRLMCISMSGDPKRVKETFPDCETISSITEIEEILTRRPAEFRPDAVVFFAESITELFFQHLRYADKILREVSIPLIVINNNMDVDTKKLVLKSGADDCFTTPIHAEGFVFWISFLKRFKKFQKERPEPEPQPKFRISFQKRAFDILVSSIALILASPVMLMIAIAIRLESKGPMLYISKRAGSGYKIFNFLKFRTMVPDAEGQLARSAHLNQYANGKDPVFFKIENDPRITKLGRFLRNTSLDELPQLINVLKGDMSIVGNRPLPLYEAQQLTKEQSAMRFMTAAGITGLWQVTKRGRKDLSPEERIALDVEYARNNSFNSDLLLIAKTFPAMTQETAV